MGQLLDGPLQRRGVDLEAVLVVGFGRREVTVVRGLVHPSPGPALQRVDSDGPEDVAVEILDPHLAQPPPHSQQRVLDNVLGLFTPIDPRPGGFA